jgi:mannose-1-phosphate guanylyltransferase
MSKSFVVVLAGGKGERFWPQSRLRRPKQLLPIVGDQPMLVQTVERVLPVVPPENVLVLTNNEQAAAVRRLCKQLPKENIVAEPVGRDSGPAVGLAAQLVALRDPKAVFASVHSDAAIHDGKAFQRDLRAAFTAAARSPVIVTIGVPQTEPATGFGYIQRGEPWETHRGKQFYRARRFVEKPTREVAEQYLKSGDYLWNTGIFVWRARVVLDSFARNAPEVFAGLEQIAAELGKGRALPKVLAKIFPTIPKIAVDYAVLEKADNVVVLPAGFDWDDVGSWNALTRHFPADAAGNIVRGPTVLEEARDNVVISSPGHLTGVFGVEGMIVVHTDDATLVVPKARAADIKNLLAQVRARKDGGTWL